MFRMVVEGHFSAAHSLREYPGPCCRLHGHNYRIQLKLDGTELDELGMLIDYTDVKAAIQTVLAPFDHAFLNDMPEFAALNPTSEALARLLYHRLQDALFTTDDRRRRVRLTEVVVFETERQGVGYGEA